MKVGETCDSFTCDRRYERNPEINSLNCTESGQWNYNLSTLCIGVNQFLSFFFFPFLPSTSG